MSTTTPHNPPMWHAGLPPGARVVVAMSGGVDSSVVAALACEAGFDVVGVTMQLYDHGAATARKRACCAGQDIHDARAVASALAIPHYVLDYERRFAEAVIAPFAASYAGGETPVPCIACNQEIKFKSLLDTARELGAAALATGHYISRREGAAGPELHRPTDSGRDQSYFLFATTREQLADLRFPLGDMAKADVRALAHRLGLPIADKPDSQDICFVPSGRYSDVVRRLRPEAGEPGEIVHVDGRRLGRHAGIVNYTVGQRRGLGVSDGEPLFVVRLDAGRRLVIVGPRALLEADEIRLRDVTWLGDTALDALIAAAAEVDLHVRTRSTQSPEPATVRFAADGVTVRRRAMTGTTGDYPVMGVAPGQACVLYADGSAQARMLGGGWIASTTSTDTGQARHHVAGRNALRHPAALPAG